MLGWLIKLQNKESNFDTLNHKIQELYSLLSIANSNQIILIEFDDKFKQEKMVVQIEGKMWTKTDNPMSELRELHNILALNIIENRTITITLE